MGEDDTDLVGQDIATGGSTMGGNNAVPTKEGIGMSMAGGMTDAEISVSCEGNTASNGVLNISDISISEGGGSITNGNVEAGITIGMEVGGLSITQGISNSIGIGETNDGLTIGIGISCTQEGVESVSGGEVWSDGILAIVDGMSISIGMELGITSSSLGSGISLTNGGCSLTLLVIILLGIPLGMSVGSGISDTLG